MLLSNGLKALASCEGVELVHRTTLDNDAEGSFAGPAVLSCCGKDFLADDAMMDEVFGPSTLLVSYDSNEELLEVARQLEGQLTVSVFGESADLNDSNDLMMILETKAGRILFNQFPTGVEVCPSVVHGGPYPATTDARTTSVGTGAILRFARPVCYQGFPEEWLPDELKEENPLNIIRSEC